MSPQNDDVSFLSDNTIPGSNNPIELKATQINAVQISGRRSDRLSRVVVNLTKLYSKYTYELLHCVLSPVSTCYDNSLHRFYSISFVTCFF